MAGFGRSDPPPPPKDRSSSSNDSAAIADPAKTIRRPPPPRPPAAAYAGPGAAENTYTLIYGKKGQGKTTALRELYRLRTSRGGDGTFIDPTGRNGDLGSVVRTAAGWWAAARAARAAGRPFSIVVQPGRHAQLDPLWALAYELGGVFMAIDETQLFASAWTIDAELQQLVSLGRNRRVDIATTVRTPPELHPVFRGNADIVISFAQPSRRYADILNKDFYGDPRVPELLTRLQPFQYLRVQQGIITRGLLPVPWNKSA